MEFGASELRLERFCLIAIKSLKTKREIAVKRERVRQSPILQFFIKEPKSSFLVRFRHFIFCKNTIKNTQKGAKLGAKNLEY